MTDERDPRLTENGLDNEEDALRELRNERVSARAPSGRYPTAGRMPNAGGRFTQTGMPAVPRVGAHAAPPVPHAPASSPSMPPVPGASMPPVPGGAGAWGDRESLARERLDRLFMRKNTGKMRPLHTIAKPSPMVKKPPRSNSCKRTTTVRTI